MAHKIYTELPDIVNQMVRAYFRERVRIAGPENADHAADCVMTFVRAAVIDELQRLGDRSIAAEAKFLADGK
jgi:hypothetical protein